ncbi:MAG: hypothetical protein IJO29_06200 [Oscillospiraceae bacterium]|nr:hypothetical protein [Oscillospiraceae bacterium]
MAQTNLAYQNTSAYEESTARQLSKEQIKRIKNNTVVHKRAVPLKVVALCAAVCALLCFMIAGKLREADLYNELSTTTAQLELINSENVKMQSEIQSMTSKQNVEHYAEDVLGLEKIDSSQIEYICVQQDAVIQTTQEETNVFVKIKDKFDDFVEYIMG